MSDPKAPADAGYQADRRVNAVKNGGAMMTWKSGVNFIVYSIALVSATVAVMQWALVRDIKQDILDINNKILSLTNSLGSTNRNVSDLDTTVKLLEHDIQYQLVALNVGLGRIETTLKEHMK